MQNITNVYVVPDGATYAIDNSTGFIPAVLYEENGFRLLVVIPEALQFCFKDKKIEWKIEQFIFNQVAQKWEKADTGRFGKNAQGIDRLLVDADSMVNAQGQVVTENGVMPEIDYYIAGLGKQAIYPALQQAIQAKLG